MECSEIYEVFKPLGSDGFQLFRFKQFWHLVGDKDHQIVREAFKEGTFDPSIAETLVVLIPKETNPSKVTKFRPISLCNVI